jgi:pyruvate kinase
MTRPLMSYLAPYIADGDPLPETITVNAADLLAAVGELRRMEAERDALRELVESEINYLSIGYVSNTERVNQLRKLTRRLAAALAPAELPQDNDPPQDYLDYLESERG